MKQVTKRIWGRWLTGLLSLVLVLTLLPAAAPGEGDGGTTGPTAMEQVQALINALPDAETITADNRADVEAQLAAIDTAMLALTGDEAAALDTTRYDAAVTALSALDASSVPPDLDPGPEPDSEPEPDLDPDLDPVATSEPEADPDPVATSEPFPEPAPEPEPESELISAPSALEQVQALINALPDANAITADNRADVEALLTAIDEAKLALGDGERDALDITRYVAAVEALLALDGMAGADEPMTIENVPYIDGGGSQTQASATAVTSSATTWDGGWYVVNENVTISDRITVSGDVHLILANDCTLMASGGGINVSSDNSLTIYGQSGQTGSLTATGSYGSAGIGGRENSNGGTVTINGGTVNATGGYYGAGIGGGRYGAGGVVTINGGTVNATGGQSGAGIGGGENGAGGTVTVYGGTVTANGGTNAAGIGGGSKGDGGNITIYGGTVNATGGQSGAGIGGGTNSAGGGTVTINGGLVTANDGGSASGIGGGFRGAGGTVTINGGTVIAIRRGSGAGIGGGQNSTDGGSFSTGAGCNAVIDATSISDVSNEGSWSGIIFNGNIGKIYGTPIPAYSFAIPYGKTLLVDTGHPLHIVGGVTVDNQGTINVGSADDQSAFLNNEGTIINQGTIGVWGTLTHGESGITNQGHGQIAYHFNLEVDPPIFAEANRGYAQPDAQSITITSTDDVPAKIISVEITGDDFVLIDGAQAELNKDQTDASWKIQPRTGLSIGPHTATITVTYGGNPLAPNKTATANVTFTVKNVIPTVTVSASGEPTYGSDITLTAQVTADGVDASLIDGGVTFSAGTVELGTAQAANGTATLTVGGSERDKQHALFGTAGSSTVTAAYTGNDSVDSGSGSGAVTVSQRKLEYDVTADGRKYAPGNTAVAVHLTPKNLVENDNVTLTATGNLSAADAATYGSVDLTEITIGGADQVYYTVADKADNVPLAAPVTIDRDAAIVATPPTGKTGLIYTGAEQALVEAGAATGGTMQYSLDGMDYSPDIPTAVNAGTYTVYYKVAGDANHTDTAAQSITVIVGAATPAVTVDTVTGTYGNDITLTANVTVAGVNASLVTGTVEFKDGDTTLGTATVTGGTATLTVGGSERDKQRALFGESGSSTVTATYAGNDNIESKSGTGAVTVNPKTLDFTFTATSRAYDQTTVVTGTFAPTDLVSGDDVTVSAYTASVENANAGDGKSVTASVTALGGTDAKYYEIGAATGGTVNITPAELALTVNAVSITYGAKLTDDLLNGSTAKISGTDKSVLGTWAWDVPGAMPAVSDSGSTKYRVVFTPSSENPANFTETSRSTEITVTVGAATSTVTVQGVTGAYGEDITLTANVTVAGVDASLINDDVTFTAGTVELGKVKPANGTATLTVKGSEQDKQHALFGTAGSSTVTATYTGNGNIDAGNGSAAATISQRKLEYDVTADDRAYEPDNTAVAVHLKPTNLVENDDVTLTATGNLSAADADTYESVDLTEITIGGVDEAYYTVDSTAGDVALTAPVTISKIKAMVVTIPTGKADLTYTGEPLALLTAGGTSNGGTMQYYVGEKDSTERPDETADWKDDISAITATEAGAYTVWYRANGNIDYSTSDLGSITVTIAKAGSSVTKAPTANVLIYNGSAQALVTAGAADGGALQYSLDEAIYSPDIPTAVNAGTYTVWYMVTGDANHIDTAPQPISVAIGKGEGRGSVSMKDYLCMQTDIDPEPQSDTNGTENVTYTYTVKGKDEYSDTKPLIAGEYTVKAVFAQTDNYNEVTATADFTINHHFNEDWEEGSDGYHYTCPCMTDVRLQKTGFTEVPDGLKENEALNTVDKISQVLVEEVTKGTSIPDRNTTVCDVRLQIRSGVSDWVDVTEENFPEEGVSVTLPYPDGTNASYSFIVVHMFTTTSSSHMPGDMEILETTNEPDGIHFTVKSLSPFAIGWTAGDLTVTVTDTGDGADPAQEWHFRVELDEKTINGDYGDMRFADGVAEFTLRSGQSLTARDLPEGAAYTVTELNGDQNGYTTTCTGDRGIITSEQNMVAAFINDKPAPGSDGVPPTGDDTPIAMYAAVLFISLSGVFALAIGRKYRKREGTVSRNN